MPVLLLSVFIIIIIINTTLPALLVSDKTQRAAFVAQGLRTPPNACSPVCRCAFCSQCKEQSFKTWLCREETITYSVFHLWLELECLSDYSSCIHRIL